VLKEILYDWGGANVWLFHVINNVRGDYLDQIMLTGTRIGSHVFFPFYLAAAFVVALVVVGRALRDEHHVGQRLGLVWLGALAVFSLGYVADGAFLSWIKPFLDFPRPPLALEQGSLHILGEPEFHHSLPSGHASYAMLVGVSFWTVAGKAGRPILVAFVLWVGISRISVGAHFPADVLASWLTALPVVLLARVIVFRCLPGAATSYSLAPFSDRAAGRRTLLKESA
jgi:membrane-associated phospholipid phosphatase